MAHTSDPQPQTLYLIDGHAQIFRAYYAIRGGMTSPVTGEPTNAVFAFTGMLIKLLEKFHPHYVVMAIDMPGRTFRDDLYEDYKATRQAPPQDLIQQFDKIFEVTRMFGIPVLGQEDAEADDVIATLTQRVLDDPQWGHVQVRVVSKDKDLEQLLGDRVTMFDIHTDTTVDSAWLMDNRGIKPDQVIDLLTLTGDKVDNIPGVDGLGPKTAAKLLQQYGSVDGVLANLDEIKGKRKLNIENARPTLPLTRELVTLKRNLAFDFQLDQSRVSQIDASGLRKLFRTLGFRRHLTDLDRLLNQSASTATPGSGNEIDTGFGESLFHTAAPVGPGEDHTISETDGLTTAKDYDYQAITTQAQLQELVSTLGKQPMVSVDTETVGLGHRAGLCGLCFAWESGSGVYVPVLSPKPDEHMDAKTVLEALRPILQDPNVPKCGHNLKYDLLVLRHAGVDLQGIVFDTMIASHLIGAPGHGLDDLALSLLGHQMVPISQLIGPRLRGRTQKTIDTIPLDQIVPYAAEDADITLRLYELMAPQLRELGLQELAGDVEMPLVTVLADMEYHGVKVDLKVLGEQKQELGQRVVELRQQIHSLAGCEFNVDSPKQLAQVLFEKLGLPVVKRRKTGPSTDNEVLQKLRDMENVSKEHTSLVELVMEYRQLTKLLNTYLDNLADSIDPASGRVHATFHQGGAATGRLSSSNPNLQNIPIRTQIGKRIRKAFIADPGPPANVLICADYSQIELRVLAHLSGDPTLIDAFDKDMDIHVAVASEVFGVETDQVTPQQRDEAKTINFGIIYGISPYGLARRVDGMDIPAAKALIDGYKQRFDGIDTFLAKCVEQATQTGYVTTILGRRRAIPQIMSDNAATRTLAHRLAINTVVQGSAADLIKQAMVNLHQLIHHQNLPMRLLLQIHDELVLETPQEGAAQMAAIVQEQMEQAMKLKVPLKVDVGVGANWLLAK